MTYRALTAPEQMTFFAWFLARRGNQAACPMCGTFIRSAAVRLKLDGDPPLIKFRCSICAAVTHFDAATIGIAV